jgi:hypothetical protein
MIIMIIMIIIIKIIVYWGLHIKKDTKKRAARLIWDCQSIRDSYTYRDHDYDTDYRCSANMIP